MSQYITLLGADDVSRAAGRMVGAADDMGRAASTMEGAFERQRMFMDAWLDRLEAILNAKQGG